MIRNLFELLLSVLLFTVFVICHLVLEAIFLLVSALSWLSMPFSTILNLIGIYNDYRNNKH